MFYLFVSPQPPTVVDSFGLGHSSIPASPTYHHKLRTSSGDSCRQMRHNAMMLGEYYLSVKYQLQDAVILFPVYHLLPPPSLPPYQTQARPVKLSNFCLNINLETTQLHTWCQYPLLSVSLRSPGFSFNQMRASDKSDRVEQWNSF